MSAFLPNLDLSKVKSNNKTTRNAETRFPCKLYRMLLDCEERNLSHIVSWHPDGTCFKVHEPDLFCNQLMPVYFKPGKYRSFQRQLNLYGFQRFTSVEPFWESCYRHPDFARDQRFGCTKIDRPLRSKKSTSSSNSTGGRSGSGGGSGSDGCDHSNKVAASSSMNDSGSSHNNVAYQDQVAAASAQDNDNGIYDHGGAINVTDINANDLFGNRNQSHHIWSDQDEEWLNNQSADLREQILSDRAAARWRRRSEGIFGALISSTDPLIVDDDDQLLIMEDDDALDFNNPAPLSASAAAPLADFDWDTPAILRQEPIVEPSQYPQQQLQMQQEQQPQPEPERQLSLVHNASQAMDTTTTALMSDDLNLCQQILGPDCDLCKDNNKMLTYDFLQQQEQY